MKLILEKICTRAYSRKETVYHSYVTALKLIVDDVPGCFVECGVAMGSQIAAMQVAIQEMGSDKEIWGFDSFQGIPMAGPNDEQQPGIGTITHDVHAPLDERLVSSGITAHALEDVILAFQEYDLPINNIHFIEGWFQDTLPFYSKTIDGISILRLDGDLYESTKICLEYLYPLVVTGGVVIYDDWDLPGSRLAVYDYFAETKQIMPEPIEVLYSGGVHYIKK